MSTINKIEYGYDAADRIVLPTSKPPFDGSDVLIKLEGIGWVEARWLQGDPDWFCWCCLDDKFKADLDDATHWAPLPVEPKPSEVLTVCQAING